MNSQKELVNALRAGFSLFYAKTDEMGRTVSLICEAVTGFKNKAGIAPYQTVIWDLEKDKDPDQVIEILGSKSTVGTVVVAKNFNWFLFDDVGNPNKQYVQSIQNKLSLISSKEFRHALVIVSDAPFEKAIPETLKQEFLKISFSLPSREEVVGIYDYIVESAKELDGFEMPDDAEKSSIVDSAVGLTKQNATQAISMGLIAGDGRIDPKVVSSFRAAKIEDVAGLKVGNYEVPEPRGYDQVKKFALAGVDNDMAKGILLLGPPGCGKTLFAKWLSTQSKKILIEMEMAKMQGEGLYGQAENAWAKAIDTVKAVGKSILFVDEIEKGLPNRTKGIGVQDQTGQRSASQFLKFLSDDRPAGCYVIATCNDISSLPPEWVRAERWDCAPFFIDLPNADEREDIFTYYLNVYDVKPGKLTAADDCMEGWSGAEIKTVCRLAALHKTNCDKVSRYVIPVSKTMGESIDSLRAWAKDKTIPASTKFIGANGETKRTRGVEL
jgi:ATP-dependent 26S proteasome regulatory subunit